AAGARGRARAAPGSPRPRGDRPHHGRRRLAPERAQHHAHRRRDEHLMADPTTQQGQTADPTAIARRYPELHPPPDNIRTMWQVLAEFFAPYKANITVRTFPGTLKTQRLFDSAGVHAANKLAAMIHGGLTNQAQKWFSLRLRDRALNDVKANRDWLEEVA